MEGVEMANEKLIADYKAEYRRTTGKDIEVVPAGSWIHLMNSTGSESSIQKHDLVKAVAILKQRHDYKKGPK